MVRDGSCGARAGSKRLESSRFSASLVLHGFSGGSRWFEMVRDGFEVGSRWFEMVRDGSCGVRARSERLRSSRFSASLVLQWFSGWFEVVREMVRDGSRWFEMVRDGSRWVLWGASGVEEASKQQI